MICLAMERIGLSGGDRAGTTAGVQLKKTNLGAGIRGESGFEPALPAKIRKSLRF
jgi:hypothetical protein